MSTMPQPHTQPHRRLAFATILLLGTGGLTVTASFVADLEGAEAQAIGLGGVTDNFPLPHPGGHCCL